MSVYGVYICIKKSLGIIGIFMDVHHSLDLL